MADHDIDEQQNTQITIYSGRGVLIESETGPFWLWGTGSEHHVLDQYQLVNTRNVFMGQIQTETPYFQPISNAVVPFNPVPSLRDPDFVASCAGVGGQLRGGLGPARHRLTRRFCVWRGPVLVLRQLQHGLLDFLGRADVPVAHHAHPSRSRQAASICIT
ncbi:hypothetical protein VTK26DRAFT_6049 [Humicola hyalothermophila]